MKILQINKFLHDFGGSESYMFNLSCALEEQGHNVEFWGMENSKNKFSNHTFNIKYIDYSKQGIYGKIKNSFRTIYNFESKNKLKLILDDFKPDIIHLHNYNFQITPSILPQIKKKNTKIVQTIHDSQLVCPYHRLYNYRLKSRCMKCVEGAYYNCIVDRCFNNSIAESTIGAIESYLYHKLDYYNKYIDHLICPSNFLANLIKKKYKKSISVVPNFFEFKKKLNLYNDEDYFLYYGRISEEKGVQRLPYIFNRAKLKLKIVGKGPIQHQFVNSKHVEYLGPLYDEELYNIVKNAKFVIQPSNGYENCPMTVIEAFSFGVPVIGPNHSGFRELIINQKTGFLLDFNVDNYNLIKTIKQINESNVENMKSNITNYYKNNLTKKIHLKKILNIYNQIVG